MTVVRASIRAVLIDLDGTLVDTLSEITAAVNATLSDAGRPPVDTERIANVVGEGASHLIGELFGGDVDHWMPLYMDHYRALNGSSATLYPGVRDGLAAMRDAGLKLACVTNKPRELVAPLLDRLGIVGAFDAIIGGGDTVEKKPKPAPLLAACRLLDVAPDASVMIGDSINDAVAARAAGAISLTVPYGYPGAAGDAGRAPALLARGLTHAIVDDLVGAARWIASRTSPGDSS